MTKSTVSVPPKPFTTYPGGAVVSVLLRGRQNTGVGRVEADEIAKRFLDGARAVKNHGEWFVVPPPNPRGQHTWSEGFVWSVAAAAHYLFQQERGMYPSRPERRCVLRAELESEVGP